MKKKLLVVSLVVLAFAGAVFADFRADENPTWAILTDTAYTLRGGEWNIDLGGALSYGIIDGLMLQTNLYLWFPQFPNVQAKWTILPDSASMPAIGIGGSFGMFSMKWQDTSLPPVEISASLSVWNLSAYISKKIGDTIWLTGSYTYNSFNVTGSFAGSSFDLSDILSSALGTNDPTGVSNATLSFIYQLSPGARLVIESTAAISQSVSFTVIPGVAWAFGDNFRLKLFIFTAITERPVYFPGINLAWKIK